MLAEIITIGDEILIGQIVDTNSAWLAQQLNLIGIKVKQITSVSDNETHILESLQQAEQRADIILITGGLGPTKDDITKHTLCKYFNTHLVFSNEAYADVEYLFSKFGRTVSETNRKQAEIPESCTLIHNYNGTAPGMWFQKNNKVFVSMPGVPYEMMEMVTTSVLPKLKEHFKTPSIFHKTILTQGIGESMLSDLIEDWENSLPNHIKLAYLPSPGLVRMRLSAYGGNINTLEKEVNHQIDLLLPLIEKYVYGYNDDELEKVLGSILIENNSTVACAESCTGGYLSHKITSISGSSAYFKGSVIAYSNIIKEKELYVSSQTLKEFGAVSQQTAEQMAMGVLKKYDTDFAISTTGIAGPNADGTDKPVGLVWIAVASKEKVFSKQFQFGDNRERNIQRATIAALAMLRKFILKQDIER
ncbi:MAG: competence/damage-inducible protein A [Bacteroidota bacterium]